MKLKRSYWIGAVLGLIVIVASFFLVGPKFLFFVMGVEVIVAVSPFVYLIVRDVKIKNEKDHMFLEFTNNLAESVKMGTPISKSIINVKNKPYGVLSPHIKKLANQIYLGIPLSKALEIFAKDVDSRTVSRAITLIGQAEKSGGDIGVILDSVAGAVNTSDKLKKERKATISTLVTQGYIIFFVFLIIVLILQFKIIPMISGVNGMKIGSVGITQSKISNQLHINTPSSGSGASNASNAFLYLLLVQGFFSGLTIGKLADKNLKAGIKHSFILMLFSFLISSGAGFFFG